MKYLLNFLRKFILVFFIITPVLLSSCEKEETIEYIDISGLWESELFNNVARIENSPSAVLFHSPDNSGYLYCSEISTNKYSFGGMGYIEVINENRLKISGSYYNRVDYEINTDLEDYWVREDDGLEIYITGVSAITTYVPSSSIWYYAIDAGVISETTFKFKAISSIWEYGWSCKELWLYIYNGYPEDTLWSDDGSITMSNDGKTIYVKSTDPFTYDEVMTTYVRKGSK